VFVKQLDGLLAGRWGSGSGSFELYEIEHGIALTGNRRWVRGHEHRGGERKYRNSHETGESLHLRFFFYGCS
jgi:hypothetical protein